MCGSRVLSNQVTYDDAMNSLQLAIVERTRLQCTDVIMYFTIFSIYIRTLLSMHAALHMYVDTCTDHCTNFVIHMQMYLLHIRTYE